MKKVVFVLSALIVTSSVLCAATKGAKSKDTAQYNQGSQNNQGYPNPNCNGMSVDEQNFANQLSDMNNRSMFCSQFSPQQRRQAMNMMGQTDSQGNVMTADDCVQQVMQTSGMQMMPQRKQKSSGGCPVK